MKKGFMTFMGAALCVCALVGFAACGNSDQNDQTDGDIDGNAGQTTYSVYAPDGAPALSLVYAISQNTKDFEYHVVDSSTISSYVTGDSPAADFCILPLNAASKLLGTGETYRMLGTVTNGNLYFLTTGDNAALAEDNLSELIGKTVGVVQLSNVPGLTLQVVLNKYNLDYQIVESLDAEQAEDKVNLLAVDATNVTPAYGCDYYLCPEPAATTKINGTASSGNPFSMAGDLQELYGDEGYPQAVIVAKTSAIGTEATANLVSYLTYGGDYLQSADTDTILELLDGVRTEGLTPSFSASNLNATVIANCSIWYTPADDCKETVNAFLEQLIAVNESAASTVSDQFFYTE